MPDPTFPFLGVHFTRRMSGLIECGPNAVLAFAREGYKNTTVNLRDLAETLTYPGFWRLADALLANRRRRNVAQLQQAGLRPRAATPGPRDQIGVSRLGPRRRPRPGRQPRRQDGRRLRDRRNRPRGERRKRALARGHGVAQHWEAGGGSARWALRVRSREWGVWNRESRMALGDFELGGELDFQFQNSLILDRRRGGPRGETRGAARWGVPKGGGYWETSGEGGRGSVERGMEFLAFSCLVRRRRA